MGITKSDFFTDEQNELAQMFKALAHPARIAIIQYLVKVDIYLKSNERSITVVHYSMASKN